MWIELCLGLTFGLLASSWANFTQEVKVRGCSYKGVFYVQGNDRHTLTFEEAQKLCSSVEATVASAEEITAAYGTGMEICRYGWISDGNLTIVRQKPNPLCRSSLTGVIIFKPGKNETSDAFCYDDSDLSDKNCTLAINLSSTEDPPVPPSKIPKTEETSVPPNDASTTDNNPLSDPTASDWPEQSTLTSVTDTENTAVTTDDSPFQSSTTPFLPPIDTTEPDTNEFLTTESSAQTQQTEVNGKSEEQSTTIVMTLDNTSSGMWEPPAKDLETTVDPSDNSYTYTGETTSTDLTSQDEKNLAGSGGRMISEDDDKSSDWLIIVGVIVAVLAILLICAAVATRKRWCGKRQTLMITSKSSSDGNGATASASSSRAQEREQEMVTLMNKEKIQENGNTEEFTVITLEESPEKNQQA
ncbi:CD44 antigen [Hoplias malabaricus]|uniref:CD44 antigen n=1 Tax=Hoplias malabaricus TaxID=27720 RepID=UPI0034623097